MHFRYHLFIQQKSKIKKEIDYINIDIFFYPVLAQLATH